MHVPWYPYRQWQHKTPLPVRVPSLHKGYSVSHWTHNLVNNHRVLQAGRRGDGGPGTEDNDDQNKNNEGPRRRGRPRKVSPGDELPDTSGSTFVAGGDDLSEHEEARHAEVRGEQQQQQQQQQQQEDPMKRRRGRPGRTSPAGGLPSNGKSSSGPTEPRPGARPRGRPRSTPSSPPPPCALPARDLELRLLLLQLLQLQPWEFKPPMASWRKLKTGITPGRLVPRVTELRDALGLDVLRCIARRCPHALLLTSTNIQSKLDQLNRRLLLTRQRLLAAVSRYPAMLGYSPDVVGSRVVALVQQLGKSECFVADMVASQPELLGMSPAVLKHRAGLLHEAASLLPSKWGRELEAMKPSTLGRLLRCSDIVLERLVYTYLRTATNGRKFNAIRAMATICCIPAVRWRRDNPPFSKWLEEGRQERLSGALRQWPGWYQAPEDVDWWSGVGSSRESVPGPDWDGGSDGSEGLAVYDNEYGQGGGGDGGGDGDGERRGDGDGDDCQDG